MAETAQPAVVVLNFHAAPTTVACVRRLLEATHGAVQVLLIDNGSGESDVQTLREGILGLDAIELRVLPQNVGYCAAVNKGLAWCEEVGARHVLLLNNDVMVEDGFLGPMVAVLDKDPNIAGVAPTVLRPDGKVWSQGAELRFGPNVNRLRGEGADPAPRETGPKSVGYLPGACVLYRLTDLTAVAGLDESYFMYFEDAALGDQLRRRGRRVLWLPWVRVTHDASASSGGGRSPLRKYMTAVNAVRFLKSRFRIGLWSAFLLFDCLGLPLAYLASGWRAGWAKTVGIFDGLRGRQVRESDVARWRQT